MSIHESVVSKALFASVERAKVRSEERGILLQAVRAALIDGSPASVVSEGLHQRIRHSLAQGAPSQQAADALYTQLLVALERGGDVSLSQSWVLRAIRHGKVFDHMPAPQAEPRSTPHLGELAQAGAFSNPRRFDELLVSFQATLDVYDDHEQGRAYRTMRAAAENRLGLFVSPNVLAGLETELRPSTYQAGLDRLPATCGIVIFQSKLPPLFWATDQSERVICVQPSLKWHRARRERANGSPIRTQDHLEGDVVRQPKIALLAAIGYRLARNRTGVSLANLAGPAPLFEFAPEHLERMSTARRAHVVREHRRVSASGVTSTVVEHVRGGGWSREAHYDSSRALGHCAVLYEGMSTALSVMVTGSRNWTDAQVIRAALKTWWDSAGRHPGAVLLSGACPTSADRTDVQRWERNGRMVRCSPVDWATH